MAVEWRCDKCELPIADGDGSIFVLMSEVRAAEQAAETAPEGGTLTQLISHPSGEAIWHVLHSACDPNDDQMDYSIAVERARTPWQLIDWTAHLMEKTWLRATGWDRILRRAHAQSGEPDA